MKLTNKERNALTVFDWKINGRTKHNKMHVKRNNIFPRPKGRGIYP